MPTEGKRRTSLQCWFWIDGKGLVPESFVLWADSACRLALTGGDGGRRRRSRGMVRLIPLTTLLPACKFLRERVARRASSEMSWKQRDHQERHQRHQVEYWVVASTLSLIVAGSSLIFARRSVKASRELIKQQKQPARYAAQPMLWVDIRGDDGQGEALVLLLGNSGPSIARHVRVTFDPAPPATQAIKPILAILEQASPHCRQIARCIGSGAGLMTESTWTPTSRTWCGSRPKSVRQTRAARVRAQHQRSGGLACRAARESSPGCRGAA